MYVSFIITMTIAVNHYDAMVVLRYDVTNTIHHHYLHSSLPPPLPAVLQQLNPCLVLYL